MDICSPDGGKLQGDGMSHPRVKGKLMADDLISLGFICSPQHSALVDNSKPISRLSTTTRRFCSLAAYSAKAVARLIIEPLGV